MSTSPAKSPLAAEGDADGVADWAKPEIGTASIRMIRAMTGIRCIAILLLCSQRRQPTGISSDGWALHVLQKPDVRPVRHPRPRHRLALFGRRDQFDAQDRGLVGAVGAETVHRVGGGVAPRAD